MVEMLTFNSRARSNRVITESFRPGPTGLPGPMFWNANVCKSSRTLAQVMNSVWCIGVGVVGDVRGDAEHGIRRNLDRPITGESRGGARQLRQNQSPRQCEKLVGISEFWKGRLPSIRHRCPSCKRTFMRRKATL